MMREDAQAQEDPEGWVSIELPPVELAEALRVGVGDDSELTTLIAAALAPAKMLGKPISTPTSMPPVCKALYAHASDELQIKISPLYCARSIVDSDSDLISAKLSESEAVEVLARRVAAADVLHIDLEDSPSTAMLIAAALAPVRREHGESLLGSIRSETACNMIYSLSRDELEISMLPLHRLLVTALFDRAHRELSAAEIGAALSLGSDLAERCLLALVDFGVLFEQQKFGLDRLRLA